MIDLSAEFAEIHAPSSHGSRPWTTPREVAPPSTASPDAITIEFALDRTRALRANRNVAREMALTLSLYVDVFNRAMRVYGQRVPASVDDGGLVTRAWIDDVMAGGTTTADLPFCRVTYLPVQGGANDSAIRDLWRSTRRRTTRGRLAGGPGIALPGIVEGAVYSDGALRFLGREGLAVWLDLYAELGFRDFSDQVVWGETWAWLRNDTDCLDEGGKGLRRDHVISGRTRLERALRRWSLNPVASPPRLRNAIARVKARETYELLSDALGLIVLSHEDDQRQVDLIEESARLSDWWARLDASGLGVWPVSVLTQFDDTRDHLCRRLELSSPPVFCAIVGVSAA